MSFRELISPETSPSTNTTRQGGGWVGGGAFPSTVGRNKSWAVALNPGQPWPLGALAMSGDLLGCHDPGREWG